MKKQFFTIGVRETILSSALLVLIFLLASFGLAISAYADTRSSLRDEASSIRNDPSPPPPATPSPLPAPLPAPAPTPSGGITNTTSGAANSGNNQGGDVETGDENVEVHVVNEGPTNSNTTVTETTGGVQTPPPPTPKPKPKCDPRSREGCLPDGSRAR